MPISAEKVGQKYQKVQIDKRPNIYTQSRVRAGFNSRDDVIEFLPIGWRTLSRIESGKRDATPEEVLCMAEAYHDENLPLRHCSGECPIGKKYGRRIEGKDLAPAVLSLLKEHNDVGKDREKLIEIAADNVIDENEKPDWDQIMNNLSHLAKVIEEIQWWARSQAKQKPAQARVAEQRVPYTKKAATLAAT